MDKPVENGERRFYNGHWWYRVGLLEWVKEGETARAIERYAEAQAWRRRVEAWRASPRGW